MKYILFILAILTSSVTFSQIYNPVNQYIYKGKLGAGRSTPIDQSAYMMIGPDGGANAGIVPPRVSDTAAIGGVKRNGLQIFSLQLNKPVWWDSIGGKWTEMGSGSGDSDALVVLQNGSSTIGSPLILQNTLGDSAWIKTLLQNAGVTIRAQGDTIYIIEADTALMATRARVKTSIDSLALLIGGGGGGTGTVTDVSAGFGTNFPLINTTGSVIVDSFVMATRARVQKAIDSIKAAGTTGAIQFNTSNAFDADGTKLFWDNSAKRLGIGGASPSSTVTITDNGLGVAATETDGLSLENNTAATVGAQQRSPGLRFLGQGWKTNATAGSQPVEFINYLLPVQSTVNPSYSLNWDYQINGGTKYTPMQLGSTGLKINGAGGAAGGISFGNSVPGANTIIGTTTLGFTLSSTAGVNAYAFATNGSPTSGSYNHTYLYSSSGGFNPTSGTATYSFLKIYPIINQTGGASGITRGIEIDINGTLTAADYRAIESDTGKVMFNGGLYLRSQPAAVTTGNYTVGGDENFIYLADLTTEGAGRNVVMPSSGQKGRLLYIFNTNSDATHKWTFTTTTVEDAAGAAVTTLTDQKCYTLYFYDTTWKVLSIQ